MSFVIDGSEWNFNGLSAEQIEEKIEAALEFVATSTERDEEVMVGDEFQTRSMLDQLSLWRLFGETSPISLPRELSQELAAWLGRSPLYTEAVEWPDDIEHTEVTIGDEARSDNIDVAWVHHSVRAKRLMACFSFDRSGPIDTVTDVGRATVYFVKTEADRIAFWRNAIVADGNSAESLIRYADHAYPNVFFVEGFMSGLSQLGGGYSASRRLVQDALAALDDRGYWIFTGPPPAIAFGEAPGTNVLDKPTDDLIQKRFLGLGLNAAPENHAVRNDTACRTAREIKIDSRVLYCEWHIKLERHRNRIHIHAPVDESRNQIVVGMIAEHLPLPGN